MSGKIKKLITTFKNYAYNSSVSPIGFYNYTKSHQLTPLKQRFAESLSFFRNDKLKGRQSEGILLTQMVKDYEYTIKLAAAAKAITERKQWSLSFYDVDWMYWIGWDKKFRKLYNRLFTSALKKIHLHFGDAVLFYCEDKFHNQQLIKQQLETIAKQLTRPEDILNISFGKVLVGDLLYDTYLRYYHQPTIVSINKEVLNIIEIGLNIYYNFDALLTSNKNIKGLLTTYSSYIEHGLPARICLAHNVDVYTIGSNSYLIQKLEKDFPYHQINHTLFSENRQLTDAQIDKAKQIFTVRFEGKIDAATSYMRTSAFADKPIKEEVIQLFKENKRNIIIYVHDFYDSPHVNKMLQFPDLYQYLKHTLEALLDLKDTTVFIKTHPNGIAGCKEKTIELVNSYNKSYFKILDESVSNLSVIQLKPDLIATARGTVCLEMAYFGIPTVALYDNLYTKFSFTHTCFDKATYFAILKGEQQPINNYEKRNIFSFYYQAFLDKTSIIDTDIFKELASFKGDNYTEKYLEFLMNGNYPDARKRLFEYYLTAFDNL